MSRRRFYPRSIFGAAMTAAFLSTACSESTAPTTAQGLNDPSSTMQPPSNGTGGAADSLQQSAIKPAFAYVYYEDDFLTGGSTQAVFDGNWGTNGDAMVRWWKDSGVVRGEIKSVSIAKARPGYNPKCIAVKIRWQKVSGSASFSVPISAGATVGITETSDGYTVSCRVTNGTTPPHYISLAGAAYSSWALTGVNVDICHKATATSVWACATDANSVGGA
jgi:hypothetical protein